MLRQSVHAFVAAGAALVLTACSPSADSEAISRHHYGDWETDIGYTQVVRVGNTLHLSGVVGSGTTLDEQLSAIYQNIEQILSDFDATLADVVNEVVFTTDMEALQASTETRRAFFDGQFPASSWVQIERLFMPEAMVEVEIQAVLGAQ